MAMAWVQVEKCLRVSTVEPVSLDGQLQSRGGHLHFDSKREHRGDNAVSMSKSVKQSVRYHCCYRLA